MKHGEKIPVETYRKMVAGGEDVPAPPAMKRPAKYRNTKCATCTTCDIPLSREGGKTHETQFDPPHEVLFFDSLGERACWHRLLGLQSAGIIRRLQRQAKFILQDGFTTPEGKKIRAIKMVIDFTYENVATGQKIAMDFKGGGRSTPDWKIKAKLFAKKFPEYILVTSKGDSR